MSAMITAKDSASRRTKNRIIENGPEFNLGREMPVICFGGGEVKARLLHAIRTDWVGWVPSDEINVKVRK